MKPGDRFVFWIGGNEAGVYAIGFEPRARRAGQALRGPWEGSRRKAALDPRTPAQLEVTVHRLDVFTQYEQRIRAQPAEREGRPGPSPVEAPLRSRTEPCELETELVQHRLRRASTFSPEPGAPLAEVGEAATCSREGWLDHDRGL